MTSARGQNVSMLHFRRSTEPWDPPITAFTDAGGSLRSAPRSTCFKADKNAFAEGKSSGQCFVGNSSSGSLAKCNSKGFVSGKDNSVTVTSGDVSSSAVIGENRELSPVRWCDREVDGVYLGKSGWVQVHQRSSGNGSRVIESENFGVSTLPPRISFTDFYSDDIVEGKTECGRPRYLPLSAKKRGNRENRERPRNLFKDLDSVSPPSLTPIISPPPAFKDRGLEAGFHTSDGRKVFSGASSLLLRSNAIEETGSHPKSREKYSALSSPSSGFASSSASSLKHRGHPPRMPQTKSLDDTFSSRRMQDRASRSEAPLSLFGFRSLDSDSRNVDPVGFGKEPPFSKAFNVYEKERNFRSINQDENEGKNDDNFRERYLSRPRSSPQEVPNGQRTFPRSFRQRNLHRNGRRISSSEFASQSKYKEQSLGSSTSSCGSSCSSPDRKSPALNTRKYYSNQSQKSFENCFSGDGKHFNVKRSRSLQLSEKRSPNDFLLMTHSNSGKSWDRMPSECSAFSDRNQNSLNRVQPFQDSQQQIGRGSGETTSVTSSTDESLLNLMSFRKAEEEKLIKEADKEVRIITDFLNGTRSRAAARSLLLHRYLNKPEDEGTAIVATNGSEYGSHYSGKDRKPQKAVSHHPDGVLMRTQSKDRQFYSLNHDFRHRPGASRLQHFSAFPRDSPSEGDGGKPVSANPFETSSKQIKLKKTTKKNASSSVAVQGTSHETEFKKNGCVGRRPIDHLHPRASFKKSQSIAPHQLNQSKPFYEQNGDVHVKKIIDVENVYENASHSAGTESEEEGRKGRRQSFDDDSSSTSSWSSDFWRDYSSTKNAKTQKSSVTCSPSESGAPGELGSESNSRPGSAPTDDGFTTRGIDQRSLSLPRSFLSDTYGFYDFHHGFASQDKETFNDDFPESFTCKGNARTAPATPINDLSHERKKEIFRGISSARSSTISLASEPPPMPKSQSSRNQKFEEETTGSSSTNGHPCSGSDQVFGTSSKSVLEKFKKSFSSKFAKTKEIPKATDRHVKSGSECGCEKENSSAAASGLIFRNQTVENDDTVSEKLFRGSPSWMGTKEQKLWRKALKSGKYGSHDSGIQMGHRGNVDSSESQDTDLQEETDSPLLDDVERVNKSKEAFGEKGVRRANSDFGGQRLYSWDVKNHYRRNPRSARGRKAAAVWADSSEGVLARFITEQRRPRLRRSMSQPLGLDEPPSFARRSSAAKCLTLSEDERNLYGGHPEDEFVSDSESSVASLSERKKMSGCSLKEENVILAEAVWDHVSMEPSELPFRAGDVIEVLDTGDGDWWWGARGENCGYFPSVFVRLRVSQEDTVEDCLAAMAKGRKNSGQLRRGKSVSLLSNDQVRSGVVRELLNTERDFVKVLRDVREGFVFECRRRTDMFTSSQIATIFSNLEDVLMFQEKFLKDLEERVDRGCYHESCVGEIFLKHGCGFTMYSEYCNSHPMAMATLQELYQNDRYVKFFETCRLKRNLMEIPLDGYLLTPVQRICKYPLQLAELLKYTKAEHPDFERVREALETMKSVATLINERKRKMESLEKLAAWQERVEGWEGEDLIETSSELIHQGDVVRITSGMWTSNVTLFLFDHQIVYCKKDLIKRNTFIYKGRIFLDASEVIDIPDGKDQQLGVTVRHGLKIYSCSKEKWVLFCCRTAEDKSKWLEAFEEEKKVVTQDREGGLNLPPAARQLARMASKRKKGPPFKPTGKSSKIVTADRELSSRIVRSGASKAKIGRRVGTWFTFGGGKTSKIGPGSRSSSQRIT